MAHNRKNMIFKNLNMSLPYIIWLEAGVGLTLSNLNKFDMLLKHLGLYLDKNSNLKTILHIL